MNKATITSIIGCLVMAAASITSFSGCALLGPSIEKAQEIRAEREEEFNAAFKKFEAAEAELLDVLNKLDEALKNEDASEIERLTLLAQAVGNKYEASKEAAKAGADLFKSAMDDLKKAESAHDYVGTVFGWITAGLSAVLGGGGAVAAAVGRSRAREGLAGVSGALEKVKGASDPAAAWATAKADMLAALSPGAKRAIDSLRP